jgi:hypothetical protein
VILAWVNWKKSSQLSIPSIAIQDASANDSLGKPLLRPVRLEEV